MSQIKEIMTPDPETATQASTARQVAEIMKSRDTGAVPILDDDRRPIGLVTDRDLVLAILAEDGKSADTPIGDIASRDLVTVSLTDTTDDAARLLREHKVRRALVVDDDQLKGIVSLGDLANAADPKSTLGAVS